MLIDVRLEDRTSFEWLEVKEQVGFGCKKMSDRVKECEGREAAEEIRESGCFKMRNLMHKMNTRRPDCVF